MWISVCLLACFKIPLIFSSILFCFVLLLFGGMVSRTLYMLVGFPLLRDISSSLPLNSLTDFIKGIQPIFQFFRELLSDGMENQHVLLLS